MPTCYIIAGPNGAGKTTFAEEFLPNEGNTINFVNADLIAKGLSPFDPAKTNLMAGKIMLQRLDELVLHSQDFAFETTLSGTSYINRIKYWRSLGYQVHLTFLHLPNADLAKERVAQRVAEGGHDIPNDTIERRYVRGLENLDSYKEVVDQWVVYDNSGDNLEFIDRGKND